MNFAALDNATVENSDAAFLVDYQGEGEMLAVCFGFYDAAGENKFDFYKRLKKLETLSGKKINKLLLRDISSAWYHYGVPPLGGGVDESVAAIKKIIAQVKPSKTIAIGQSMGGYAAILYGALLGVDKVVSFGPLAWFDSARLEILGDRRWLEIVKKVEAVPPPVFYNNLPELLKKQGGKTAIEIFFGTGPGKNADRAEAVNYDAAHAMAFYGIDNTRLFPLHDSPHAVVEYLRANKIIDDVLLNRLFDIMPPEKDAGISPQWAAWLKENITLGCSSGQLIETLCKNNFTPDSAAQALQAVRARLALANITG